MAIQFDPSKASQKTGEAHKGHHHHGAKKADEAQQEGNIHEQAANQTQKTPDLSQTSIFS